MIDGFINKSTCNGELAPLNPELIRSLWSKTYNSEGKPDWSHIFPYYHSCIVFQDVIQKVEGRDSFIEMCNRLTKRCKTLHMEINDIIQEGNIIFMDWKMTMSFRRAPSTPLFGTTKLTLDPMGIIIEQRDYYDLWGDIYNGIPGFRKLYRGFMAKFFG
jgi:hypothetical protein